MRGFTFRSLIVIFQVLKDVGFVVIITQVTNVKTGRFDPTDGGIYAIVRFVCYAFCPGRRVKTSNIITSFFLLVWRNAAIKYVG